VDNRVSRIARRAIFTDRSVRNRAVLNAFLSPETEFNSRLLQKRARFILALRVTTPRLPSLPNVIQSSKPLRRSVSSRERIRRGCSRSARRWRFCQQIRARANLWAYPKASTMPGVGHYLSMLLPNEVIFHSRKTRARRNPDDSARSVAADAACNARQPASIIMTIEHNKSRGFARGVPGETEKREREREREQRERDATNMKRGREGRPSAGRCGMRASIRVNKCLYSAATYTYTFHVHSNPPPAPPPLPPPPMGRKNRASGVPMRSHGGEGGTWR